MKTRTLYQELLCDNCGKKIVILYGLDQYTFKCYHKKIKRYFCSYTCMKKYKKEKEMLKKVGLEGE